MFLLTDDYLISASYDTTIKVNIDRQPAAFIEQFVILIVIVIVSSLWSRVTDP